MRILHITILGFLFIQTAKSQELLTVKKAVEIALENNYDIKIARNIVSIAEENVTYGNAGLLPSLTANFNQNNNITNSTQTQQSGEVRSLDNAKNNSMNYGVSLGWTVFDGLAMFSRFETLKELQKRDEAEWKRSIVTQVSDVITTYYTIVQQKNMLDAIDSTILIS